jgi:hypothetical protein
MDRSIRDQQEQTLQDRYRDNLTDTILISEQEARNIARLLDDPQTEQKGFDHFRNLAYEIDGNLKFTTKAQQRQVEALAYQVNCHAREMLLQVQPVGWFGSSREISMLSVKALAAR